MSFKRTLTGGAVATLLAVASSSLPAQADVYHAVEPGETLSSVAARYRLTPDAIRLANRLNDTRDSAPLPTMLLLIPEANSVATSGSPVTTSKMLPTLAQNPSPTLLANASTVNAPSGKTSETTPRRTSGGTLSGTPGGGTIVQMVSYVVKQGDTLDSIARQFSKPGQPVSVLDIRRRNYISNDPAPGTMLLVPTTSSAFNGASPVSATPAISPVPSPERGAARAIPAEEEYATVLPQPNPVYRAPSAAFIASTPRRGSVLGSRGMSTDDSVRVVQPGQETVSEAAPSPRSRVMNTSSQASASTALASVAKVASSGGSIRRLPDSTAVTLYRCTVGTELAVIKQSGAWSAILMEDRSTGWIPTKYLKMTGVQVDISTQVVTRDSYQGTAQGQFRSNHPAVMQALGWLGTRYVYGGTTRRGIDCSALVMKSFAANGVRLPRTAAQQAKVGTPVAPENLQPGDRLYFSASGSRVDHTGLYMGNGQFVHASGRGRQVIVSNLFDRAHWNIFVGARR